jgi:hypothetical protein
MTKPEIFALPGTGSIRFALTFKELTLTTFYGDAICRGLGLRGVQLRRAKEE